VAGRSRYELSLRHILERSELAPFVEEYTFAKAELGRSWRFDFAWPAERVAAEVDGGARLVRWQRNPFHGRPQPVAVGRHATRADYEKMNAAAFLGWRVLRFTPDMLPQAGEDVARLLRKIRAIREADRVLVEQCSVRD